MDKKSSPLRQFLGKVFFGSIFMVVGAFIILYSLNVISSSDGSYNAPRWVFASAGLVFMLAGTLPMLQGLKELMVDEPHWLKFLNRYFFVVFIFAFAIPFNWGVFSSGSSEFVFIVFVIFLDLLVVFSAVRILRGSNFLKTK